MHTSHTPVACLRSLVDTVLFSGIFSGVSFLWPFFLSNWKPLKVVVLRGIFEPKTEEMAGWRNQHVEHHNLYSS
jgi:hypothetical protein